MDEIEQLECDVAWAKQDFEDKEYEYKEAWAVWKDLENKLINAQGETSRKV